MTRIAIGPEIDLPSWNWVGFDTARELSKYFDVHVFSAVTPIPACDVVLIIKQLPTLDQLKLIKRTNTKIVYCPIDLFQSQLQLLEAGPVLAACDMVLTHCSTLIDLFKQHCSKVHLIEHHNKYMLPTMELYKPDQFVLWIGGCQYVPYLLDWLRQHPINREIVLLTNNFDTASIQAAHELAVTLKLPLDIKEREINKHRAYMWSERNQAELMRNCGAAIDIKSNNFNQLHKPPTKAQKFIASGVPFATNIDSYPANWLRTKGLVVAAPTDEARWFSADYWQETASVGRTIREETSLKVIGAQYRDFIASLV